MEAQRWSEVPNVAQLLSGSFRSLDWNSRLLDFRTEAFGSIQQGQETSWTSEAQEMMFLRLLVLVPSSLFCHARDTRDRPSLQPMVWLCCYLLSKSSCLGGICPSHWYIMPCLSFVSYVIRFPDRSIEGKKGFACLTNPDSSQQGSHCSRAHESWLQHVWGQNHQEQ